MQELPQIKEIDRTISFMLQTSIGEIENILISSPVCKAQPKGSHLIFLDSSPPLKAQYWYMMQSVENGWSSNALQHTETNLFKRQIETQKVNNSH